MRGRTYLGLGVWRYLSTNKFHPRFLFMCKKVTKYGLSILLLSLGGLIYIIYRPTELIMFDWFQEIGIENIIKHLRLNYDDINIYEWIKYNLPAGLWLFSYMFIIDAIWDNDNNSKSYLLFLSITPIASILSEILQFFGLLHGTFDIKDILAYIGAIILFITIKFFKL